MKIEYKQYSEVGVVTLSGRVDTVSADHFKENLSMHLQQSTKLLLDFAQVNYLDSSGLGALLSGLKKALAVDGDIRLANVGPKVNLTLEITGADKLFTCYPTVIKGLNAWASEKSN